MQSNTARTVTFTIENTGVGGLLLSGKPVASNGYVTVTGPATTNIPGGGSVTFDVTFIAPNTAGTYNDSITITSNDADEGSYSIDFSGTSNAAAVPDIDILVNGMEYVPGSTYDFGDVQNFGSGVATFTIRNSGTATLNLTSAWTDSGTEFTAGTPGVMTLAPGSTTTVDVTFSPNAVGARSDILWIASDEPDPFENSIRSILRAAEASSRFLT